MITSKKYREELIENLQDKEYRDAFVSSHINNGIPFQIRALREQRDWTQDDLAKVSKKKQEAICRLENPNYGSFTLATLKEIASALDVALMVRFVPFSELVKWDVNLSNNSLEVVSFKDDLTLNEKESDTVATEYYQGYPTLPTEGTSNNVVIIADYLLRKSVSSSSRNPAAHVANYA